MYSPLYKRSIEDRNNPVWLFWGSGAGHGYTGSPQAHTPARGLPASMPTTFGRNNVLTHQSQCAFCGDTQCQTSASESWPCERPWTRSLLVDPSLSELRRSGAGTE